MSVAVVVAMTVADEMTAIVVGTLAAAAVVIGIAVLATVSVLAVSTVTADDSSNSGS